jgi:hypothetical protein
MSVVLPPTVLISTNDEPLQVIDDKPQCIVMALSAWTATFVTRSGQTSEAGTFTVDEVFQFPLPSLEGTVKSEGLQTGKWAMLSEPSAGLAPNDNLQRKWFAIKLGERVDWLILSRLLHPHQCSSQVRPRKKQEHQDLCD